MIGIYKLPPDKDTVNNNKTIQWDLKKTYKAIYLRLIKNIEDAL